MMNDLKRYNLMNGKSRQEVQAWIFLSSAKSARHFSFIFFLNSMQKTPLNKARCGVPAHFLTEKGVDGRIKNHEREPNA